MSYQAYAPFYLTYSGLCLGTASVPADLFTFTLPNSGQRYVINQVYMENLGTGDIGSVGLTVQGYLGAGGAGGPIFAGVTAAALPSGHATSINSTITGFWTGPNLTFRQTSSPGFSTPFGLSVLITPMP